MSAHLVGLDVAVTRDVCVVKVRTPVMLFLPGGQQAAAESTDAAAHRCREASRDGVDATGGRSTTTACSPLSPARCQICANGPSGAMTSSSVAKRNLILR